MSEQLVGKAESRRIGNDLFWRFLKHRFDDDGKGYWIDLKWTGYADSAWWNKWSKLESNHTKKNKDDGISYRIDFRTCDVYRVVDE